MEFTTEKRVSKSKNYCSVPQCSSFYSDNISLHKFPFYNRKLVEEWVGILKIGKQVTPHMRVCSKHFKDEDFFFKNNVIKRPRLKKNVLPTQNLPVGNHDPKTNTELAENRMEHVMLREFPEGTDSAVADAAQALLQLSHANSTPVKYKEDRGPVLISSNRNMGKEESCGSEYVRRV